jgi:hypothetical protein
MCLCLCAAMVWEGLGRGGGIRLQAVLCGHTMVGLSFAASLCFMCTRLFFVLEVGEGHAARCMSVQLNALEGVSDGRRCKVPVCYGQEVCRGVLA